MGQNFWPWSKSGWELKRGLAYPPNVAPQLEPWMERVRVTLERLLDVSVEYPRLINVVLDISDTGAVTASITPNENTKWIEYAWATDDYPTLADITTGGTEVRTVSFTPGQTHNTATLTTLTAGQTIYLGVVSYFWEEKDSAVPSGPPSIPVYVEASFGEGGGAVPTVQEIVNYYRTGGLGYGTLRIKINDPEDSVTVVEYRTRAATDSDWPSWTAELTVPTTDDTYPDDWDSGTPPQDDWQVLLDEKHNSHIAYRITYGANNDQIEVVVTYDEDKIPELVEGYLTPDFSNWDIIYRYTGDDDTLSLKYATVLDTDWASDALAYAAATAVGPTQTIDGRIGRAVVHTGLEDGQTLYVATVCYDEANGGGNAGTKVYRYEIKRGSGNLGPCQNLMGQDGDSVKGGIFGEGTVLQYEYMRVPISMTTLEPGVSKVSFCADMWVGPGQTNPLATVCDNKFGKMHNGLIHLMPTDTWQMGGEWQSLGDRDIPEGTTVVESPIFVKKDGIFAFEFNKHTGTIEFAPSKGDLPRMFVQAKFQYEGVDIPLLGGDGVELINGLSVTGRNFYYKSYDQQYFLQYPKIQIRDMDTDERWSWYKATQYGLFSGHDYNFIASDTATLQSTQSVRPWDEPLHMYKDDDGHFYVFNGWEFWFTGADPIYGTSTGDGPLRLNLGLLNQTGTYTGLGLGAGKNIDVGRVWWWDIAIMEDHIVKFTGLTPGDYIEIKSHGPGGRDRAYSLVGADANGEVDVWLNWDPDWVTEHFNISTTAPRFIADCPCNQGIAIWDGPPWDSGSTKTYECDNEILAVWGGDVWNYDPTGSQTPAEQLTNVNAVMQLDFMDGNDVLGTVSTAAYNWTAPLQRTGVANTLVPLGTTSFRFRLYKTGTDNGWSKAEKVQFNEGTYCCTYSTPSGIVFDDLPPWSPTEWTPYDVVIDSDFTGDVTSDPNVQIAIDEHRQGGGNLVQESRDERTISAGTGDIDGTDYKKVVLADHGLEPGDNISIRGKAKIT